ncbi:hypothetical protein NBRC10513v2_000795 [Rhodotorula toruloides]
MSASQQHQNPWTEQPKSLEDLKTYLVVVPDIAESKRMEVRAQHLEEARPAFANGWFIEAGATFADDSRTKMTGSYLLMRGESPEQIKARLSKDIYSEGGAWDVPNAQITPVFRAKH